MHLRIACLVGAMLAAMGVSPSLADGPKLVVERPWARATIFMSRPAAAYLTIVNRGEAPDRLMEVTSPIAGHVMLHATTMKDGIMQMSHVPGLSIGPGESVSLKPGERHLMLMDLRQPLRKGQRFAMTLRFEKAGDVAITVPIASPGATAPE